MTILERLANVFDETFGLEVEKFSENLAPEDVPNWDSVGHMNLVTQLEREFDQQFEVDEIMEMSSPAKIVEILRARNVAD